MKHIGLFEGIGGFSLAAEWMGWETIAWCELNEFCRALLKQKFPNSNNHGDIRKTDFTIYRGQCDILTGGDPCQPHSLSGMRKGKSDERYLWPEYFRAIRESQPRFIINENVFGSISNGVLDQKIYDLQSIGYTCWPPIIIPANYVGAWHKRKRVWLVAYSTLQRRRGLLCCDKSGSEKKSRPPVTLDTLGNPFTQFQQSMGESPIFRVADGIPRRMDIVKRLGGAGNAIIPGIAFYLYKAIEKINDAEFDN